MKPHGARRVYRMLPAWYICQNHVVTMDANQPVHRGQKRGEKYFQWWNTELHAFDDFWITRHRDHFADQRGESQQVADPNLGKAGSEFRTRYRSRSERITYWRGHKCPDNGERFIFEKSIRAHSRRQTDLATSGADQRVTP